MFRGMYPERKKETPEEYRNRHIDLAIDLGVFGASSMTTEQLKSEISKKQFQQREERRESRHEAREKACLERERKAQEDYLKNRKPWETTQEAYHRRQENEHIESTRKRGEELGIPRAGFMPLNALEQEISTTEWRIRENRREGKKVAREFETDRLILQAANRRPGERVSYQESLAERHAFAERGAYDAGLYRHSDANDEIYGTTGTTTFKNSSDIIKETRERQQKRFG